MQQISETAYLSAPNYAIYRTVMRVLYNEKEMLNSQMSAEEIYLKLKKYDNMETVDAEQLKNALDQLVLWENIIPMQDPRKVSTIEEYKNKQYRYSISERAVIIERMTIELENMVTESNTLSSSLLVRINEAVKQLRAVFKMKKSTDINDWWKSLQNDFKRLNQSYSDYLHTFYSVKGEKIIKSIDFIIYKDKFIQYLREFIQVLQKYSAIIASYLSEISSEDTEKLINLITDSELDIPRTDGKISDREQIYWYVRGQWNSMYKWFVSENGRVSVCETAMDYTSEIIRKLLNDAVMLMQLQNTVISRKQDYRKYMQLFSKCQSTAEAHCLSAHIFGVMNSSHYRFNSERKTDSIHQNITDTEPQIFEVKPRTRVYKPKIKSEGFESKAFEKAAGKALQIKKIEDEKNLIESYIKDNIIDLENISDEAVPEQLRKTLLGWISAARQKKVWTGITDFGRKFSIEATGRKIVLKCTDGDLYMLGYIIRFEEIKNG